MNVKGLKISDILKMDWDTINKLSERELKQVTSRLVSASNKRIKRLEKTTLGTSSFAYQSVERRGRKFSVRGKDVGQTRQEFKIAKNFLQMKTSTATGWKEYRTKVEQRTASITGGESIEWTSEMWSKFWKVFREFEERKRGSWKKGDSDRIFQMITEMFAQMGSEHSIDTYTELLDKEYRKMYEEEQPEDETDGFEVDYETITI